jgi:peptidoglycan/LPS O-acetylase OafA/YrhL
MLGVLRIKWSLRSTAIACALAALVIGELTAKSGGPGPPSAYFQPQTHAFGLLLGCALAVSTAPRWTRQLALPALIGIFAFMCIGPSAIHATYLRVSVPVVCVLTAVVLAGLEHEPPVGRVLGWAPIRRVGVISYGLYLYHQVMFSEVNEHVGGGRFVHIVVGVLVAIAVAEVSYRFYESPIRRYGRRLGRRVEADDDVAVSR